MHFWSFLAKYWHVWPKMTKNARPQKKQTRCLGVFSVMWVPKLLLTPQRIGISGPKTAKFCLRFWTIWSHARPKNNANKVPRCFFRYMGTITFAFSSDNKGFSPQNDHIWPEISIFGHFGPGLAGSFGALLVGWLVVVARGLYLARQLFTS